jgi:hypothetical protein
VTARAVLNRGEHERRRLLGIAAFTDPDLLGRLLELPVGRSVLDPVVWAETAGQPAGVVVRGDDGHTVKRLLEPALLVDEVIVPVPRGREARAIQDASLFASFTSRWVTVDAHDVPDATVMEAKLCGVGLIDREGQVIIPAEPPTSGAVDGWAWLLWEKTYRRWLKEQSPAHETASQVPATGEASATPTS